MSVDFSKDKGKGLTIEEIRSRAPKDAALYGFEDQDDGNYVYFLKVVDGQVYIQLSWMDDWIESTPNKLFNSDLPLNPPKYATHYEFQGNEVVYYAKDYIGRWCYVDDESGGGWPTHSCEWDRLDHELKPL